MENVLHVDESKCLFCRSCEIVCSIGKEGEVNLGKSRIHIVPNHEKFTAEVSVCRQCEQPPCVEACEENALFQNEETGIIDLNQEDCTGCESCVEVCPYGAITMRNDYPVVCDLCGRPEDSAGGLERGT